MIPGKKISLVLVYSFILLALLLLPVWAVAEGSAQQQEGNGQQQEGNGQLQEGNGQLQEGNGQLQDGNGQLQEGTTIYEEGTLTEDGQGLLIERTVTVVVPEDGKEEVRDPYAVGNTVQFGHYEQDGDTSNGKEPISWLVLERLEERCLLLCTTGLEAKAYNNQNAEVTWETCSLRFWLNTVFYDAAFTDPEKAHIMTVRQKNPGTPAPYCTTDAPLEGGENTIDRLFLLTFDEMESRLRDLGTVQVVPSVCATQQGAQTDAFYQTPAWLRNPGKSYDKAVVWTQYSDTTAYIMEENVDFPTACVCPMMWFRITDTESVG